MPGEFLLILNSVFYLIIFCGFIFFNNSLDNSCYFVHQIYKFYLSSCLLNNFRFLVCLKLLVVSFFTILCVNSLQAGFLLGNSLVFSGILSKKGDLYDCGFIWCSKYYFNHANYLVAWDKIQNYFLKPSKSIHMISAQ